MPSPIGICPLAASPKAVIAPVPLPIKIPPSVNVPAPVPPAGTAICVLGEAFIIAIISSSVSTVGSASFAGTKLAISLFSTLASNASAIFVPVVSTSLEYILRLEL